MNRRNFFALATASAAALAGCRPKVPGVAALSPADERELAADRTARVKLLADLASRRVPDDATFTTPPPAVNAVDLFPEMKPLQRMAVLLHPRYGNEPSAAASKLGGAFQWPAGEPWPVCDTFKIPYVPVLQLLAADAPTQVQFRPGSDVMQLLWSPRNHSATGRPKPLVVWRKRSPATSPGPSTDLALMRYVPVPMRLFPERLLETPDWHTLKVTPVRDRIEKWQPPLGTGPEYYGRHLSGHRGTKVGGYPVWLGEPAPPTCDTCKRGMDYVLTLDSTDPVDPTYPAAVALPPPGNYHVYICRRCDDWPVKAA